jgi:hypothetical protein
VLQVKKPAAPGGRADVLQISLGFKQMARALHAASPMELPQARRCLRQQPSSE